MIDFPKYVFIDDSTLTRRQVSNVIQTEMEVGPRKRKKIQTTPLFRVTFDVAINASKLNEFRSWWKNQLNDGSFWFFMKDPFDGTKRRFRFTLEDEIEWTKSGNLMRSSFELEAYDEL